MITRKTRKAYAEVAPEFRISVRVNPRIRDPKKLRHLAHNMRQAARQELEWAQTALNEASAEKGRSGRIRATDIQLAEELLWDYKVSLRWYRRRMKRAEAYRKMAGKLVEKAKKYSGKK